MYGFQSHNSKELLAYQRGQRKTKRVRLSRRFKQRIFWRDAGKCVYCDKLVPFKEATMDHVTPLTLRGKNRTKNNIVLSCRSCNKLKGPLVLECLDDLAPEQLDLKFYRTVENAKKRKGQFAVYG